MTKYILQSGGIVKDSEKELDFYNELVKGLGSKPRILLCLFAQMRELWEGKSYVSENICKKIKGAEIELAFPETFEEQIKRNDIVYIYGGDDHLVQYWLSKFDIPKIWEGKVVATNSASTDALAKHFWAVDWRQLMDGFGILPIKTIVHYKSNWGDDDPRGPIDWEKAYNDLENYGDKNLPIYALEEGDYKVFEV